MLEFSEKVQKIKNVREVIAVSGFSIMSGASENLGFAIVTLDDWSKHTTPDLSISAIRCKIMAMGASIPQGEVRVFQPPAIMGFGVTGGVTLAFRTAGGETPQEFEQQMGKLLEMLNNKQLMPDEVYLKVVSNFLGTLQFATALFFMLAI